MPNGESELRICYVDAFSGISGDMTVGALVDAGADAEAIRKGLDSLNTGAEFSFERTKRKGIAAIEFRVHGGERTTHRHLPQILRTIDSAALPEAAKQIATAVFESLAEAGAAIHDVDSICDIVATGHALVLLDVDEVRNSAINIGGGTIQADQGILPVPATASAKLLAGKPIYSRGPQVELTTPTGAAILSALSLASGPIPPMYLHSTGYGAGVRDFPEHANVLRVLIGDSHGSTS
jgi:uncharacterized protein (DUF111 family)